MSDEKHFNGLSPAEAERLALLAEECGEVVQAVCKVLRHGYESTNPTLCNGPIIVHYVPEREKMSIAIGKCCAGGTRPKSHCASCAAWRPLDTAEALAKLVDVCERISPYWRPTEAEYQAAIATARKALGRE